MNRTRKAIRWGLTILVAGLSTVPQMTEFGAWTGKRQVPLARAALEKLLRVAVDDPATVKQTQELLDKVNAIK